jgi:hypothetical protein
LYCGIKNSTGTTGFTCWQRPLLSVLIPLLNIPVYFNEAETESSIVYNTLRVFATTETDEGVTIYAGIPEKESWFTTSHLFQVLYITIASLVLLRIIFSLLKIRRIIRQHPVEKIENISFLNTDEPGTPFSFSAGCSGTGKLSSTLKKANRSSGTNSFILNKSTVWILFSWNS